LRPSVTITTQDKKRIDTINNLRATDRKKWTYERLAKRYKKQSAGAFVSWLAVRAVIIDDKWIPKDQLTTNTQKVA
jgi:mannitol-specific phosphotransferase system IIBC component